MSITTGKTVKDAIAELAAIVPRLDVLRDDEATAKDNCDDALVASIKELREQLLCEHAEAFAVIGEVRDGRRARVCRAAAAGPKPAELRKLATATIAGDESGVKLPEGRHAHCSRGKSWCRLGQGSSAEWAQNDRGHCVNTAGKWVVGSNDGFKRKEQTEWHVFVACGVFCADHA